MTPITREQAVELADKHHNKRPPRPKEICWNITESEICDLLTDFRQQVIADLARESGAMPVVCAAGDFQEDVSVCTERSAREVIASLQAKLEQERQDNAALRAQNEALDAACAKLEQSEALLVALERIADPRNKHFAGDAQVVARAAIEAHKKGQA